MKYALEMEKSSEEALTQQSKDLMQRITSLSVKVDDATAYVERLKDGLVLLEDNVKHQNFTLILATDHLKDCTGKLNVQVKKLNSYKLEEEASDATLEQSNGFDGVNSNAVKQQTKILTRKIHRQANALRADIKELREACDARNNTYVQEKVTFTKAMVELAKERREIRSKRLMNQRNIALLHLLKMQATMLEKKTLKSHASVRT